MITQMFYSCILGLLLIKAASISSNLDRREEILLTVYHYKVPCVGENVQLCYRVKKNNSEPQYFYDNIEGFHYEWGYNYIIRVEKVPVNTPASDAASFQYKLIKVIRKDRALPHETFELPLKMGGLSLVEDKNGACYYFRERAIQTKKHSCQELAKARAAVFSHNFNKPGLVLVALK